MAMAMGEEIGMTRWERFMFNRVPHSCFTDGATLAGRRATDMVTDEMVKKVANNGQSTKELIAEMSLENKVDHAVISTTLSFHNKFIWTCIGILITAFTGGIIAIIVSAVQRLL